MIFVVHYMGPVRGIQIFANGWADPGSRKKWYTAKEEDAH